MADVFKYGWAYGGKQGQELPIGLSESFYRTGGAFVAASAMGAKTVMNLCTASTDIIVGWAEVPRAAVPGIVDWWTSDATTSGKDYVHVVTDPTAVFAMPMGEAYASVSDKRLAGDFGHLYTAASIQYVSAKPAGGADAKQLFVVDVDSDEKIAYVRINMAGMM